MKKFLFEIVLTIIGIMFLTDGHKEYLTIGIAILVVTAIIFVIHLVNTRNSNKGFLTSYDNNATQYPASKTSRDEGNSFPSSSPSRPSVDEELSSSRRNSAPIVNDSGKNKEEQRITRLNEIVEHLRPMVSNTIWGIGDINAKCSSSYLNYADVEYVAKALPISLFSTTVWEFHQKITNILLTDNEIVKILQVGTDDVIDTFLSSYSDTTSWTMSASLLEKIISKDLLLVYRFENYSKSMLATIIDKLSAYELLGFRMKAKNTDEDFDSSFVDLAKSTEDDEVSIDYYESADTDMVYFLEQHYPEEKSLRQTAFNKIIAGSSNIVEMIARLDDISEDEFRQIFARNYDAEIDAVFEKTDAENFVEYLPLSYAVKAVLQIIPCEFEDSIGDNYDFANAPKDEYYQIIEQLNSDELLGYDSRGDGSYDFIKMMEEKDIEDDKLRNAAFDKMFSSEHLVDGIERWDDITEYEINKIMGSENTSFMEALFERDDTGDVIEKLPDEFIIKARLGLFDFGDLDDLNSEYDTRMENNDNVFKSKIEKLVGNLG